MLTETVILASGSPRRKELLEQIKVPFVVVPSTAAEKVTKTLPGDIVEELSAQKAADVAAKYENGIILGADTIVWADHQMMGKPKDPADAANMISTLQGKSHSVFTGVTVITKRNGMEYRDTFHTETKVHVHAMTPEEIQEYLLTGEAYDKAGAYGIQGAFAAYVDGIEGDYQTVVGLPVSEVYRALKRAQMIGKDAI